MCWCTLHLSTAYCLMKPSNFFTVTNMIHRNNWLINWNEINFSQGLGSCERDFYFWNFHTAFHTRMFFSRALNLGKASILMSFRNKIQVTCFLPILALFKVVMQHNAVVTAAISQIIYSHIWHVYITGNHTIINNYNSAEKLPGQSCTNCYVNTRKIVQNALSIKPK